MNDHETVWLQPEYTNEPTKALLLSVRENVNHCDENHSEKSLQYTQFVSSDPDDSHLIEEDPPFYVDADGHPYPAALQRLVLGRENLPESDLRPQHVEITEDGRTQVLPQSSTESSILRSYNVDARELFRPYLISRLVKSIDPATLRHSELFRSQAYAEEVVQFLNESKLKTMQCHTKSSQDCCKSPGKNMNVDSVAQMLASQALYTSPSEDEESSERDADMAVTASPCEDVDDQCEESAVSSCNEDDGDDNNLSMESSDWAESSAKKIRTYRKRKRKMKVNIPSKRIGDEVAYIRQCHRIYCDVVKTNRIYELDSLPGAGPPVVFYKITHVRTHILPPRVLSLKLVPFDESGHLDHGSFIYVRYHEIPNISSFLVLKQIYDKAMARNWMPGDRFRSIHDECWITGVILSKQPFSNDLPSCPFQCYKVKWDNGMKGRLSPWDLYPPVRRYSRYRCQPVPITSDEMRSIMYVDGEDWGPMQTRDEQIDRIVEGMNHLMETSLAEPFNAPVDLVLFPTYAAIIDYPLDLRTIRDRMKNGWYRRPSTVLSDARKISQNAKKFNRRNSGIVKKAVVLTKLLIQFIKDTNCYNIMRLYKEAVKSIVDENCSTDSNDDTEISPITQSEESNTVMINRPIREKRAKRYDDPSQWHEDCRKLLRDIMRHPDSEPFRHPVDLTEFPNYSAVIDEPIDLGTIRLRLICGSYKNPEEFAKDCRLMFKNSIAYNTNKRSRIYQMTIRLRELFEMRIPDVLNMYAGAMRHIYLSSCKSRCLSSSGDDENDEDFVVGEEDKSSSESHKRQHRREKRQAKVKRRNDVIEENKSECTDMVRAPQKKTYCTRSGGRRTVHYNFGEAVHVSHSFGDNEDSMLQFPCRDKKKSGPGKSEIALRRQRKTARCRKYRTATTRRSRRMRRRVVRTLKPDDSIYSFY